MNGNVTMDASILGTTTDGTRSRTIRVRYAKADATRPAWTCSSKAPTRSCAISVAGNRNLN